MDKSNCVLASNLNFLIPISHGVNLLYFKLRLFELEFNRIHSLKYIRFTTLGCIDIRLSKSEFVAITLFL